MRFVLPGSLRPCRIDTPPSHPPSLPPWVGGPAPWLRLHPLAPPLPLSAPDHDFHLAEQMTKDTVGSRDWERG